MACSNASSDDVGTGTANATGGDVQDEASFVYVFSPTSTDPVCSGAIISDKAIVVARSCVADDLEVALGSRGDSPWSWNKTKVTKVHVPPRGPADIAVLEIEKKLASTANLITHYPLRAGYTVFARQSVDGPGLFGTSTGTTTEIAGALVSATETQAILQPAQGTKLCARDLGAMVCSSTESTGLLGVGPRDRCGLAAIVVAPPDGGVLDSNDCSGEGWHVAPLGVYEEFLTQFAPQMFQPIVDSSLFGSSTFAPDGLWNYDSDGKIKSCSLETTKLDPAKKNAKQLVRGKASFEAMSGHSEPVAHFGLAKKNAPNVITWIPATRGSLVKAVAFDDTFTADMGAALDGEYIVTLRVSADGGESWQRCDDPNRPLALQVGDAPPAPVPTTTTTPPPPPPPASSDAGAPPPSSADAGAPAPGADDDDAKPPVPAPTDPPAAPQPKSKTPKTAPAGGDETAPIGGEDKVVPAQTVTSDSGCATAPRGTNSSNLQGIALLLGLAALVRRRRS